MKCVYCNKKGKIITSTSSEEINNYYFKNFNFKAFESLNKTIHKYYCKSCNFYYFDRDLAGDDEYYELLQNNRKGYYNPNRKEYEYAKSYSDKTKCVLEIGCGAGFFADKIEFKSYKGLEFNQLAIDKSKAKGYDVIKESIENFCNNSNDKYDVIFSFHVLEHVVNPITFISSAKKMLKKNGKLVIAVPNNNSILTSGKNVILNIPPHHINQYTKGTIKYIADYHNLELESLDDVFINHPIFKIDYNVLSLTNLYFRFFNDSELIDPRLFEKIRYRFERVLKKIWFIYPFKMNIQGENLLIVFKK